VEKSADGTLTMRSHRPESLTLFDIVADERGYRLELWSRLKKEGYIRGVLPEVLRNIGIYSGAQGIWVDKKRTERLTQYGHGVTMSLLHKGDRYPDDLDETHLLYPYPHTDRPKIRDANEINATREAKKLTLPLFIIVTSEKSSKLRDVHLGWVESWDDTSGVFLISFGEKPPAVDYEDISDDSPFSLIDDKAKRKQEASSGTGQQRFKFNVFKRYGAQCAVCSINQAELLEAVHIRPKEQQGSDDPRNGLVLCPNHHLAFYLGYFTIHPDTHKIQYQSGQTSKSLRVEYESIEHLGLFPHVEALKWHWDQVHK